MKAGKTDSSEADRNRHGLRQKKITRRTEKDKQADKENKETERTIQARWQAGRQEKKPSIM